MSLTKALSGEVEPHPCRSPHGARFPFLPVFGRNPVPCLAQCSKKHPAFVTYSNSYKIAKKWLQNCRSGVVNSKDAGLRPLCERNATMKRRSNPSKIFYIPAWQSGVVERKLAEYARCGYKPMDFQELPCSIWRITFRKSEPHSTDYYLFGRFQGGRGQTLGYFSPCGKEERKISDISRRTLVIGANLRQTARGRNTGPVRMTV